MKSALRWLRPFDVIYGRELRTATYKRKRSQWAAVAKKIYKLKRSIEDSTAVTKTHTEVKRILKAAGVATCFLSRVAFSFACVQTSPISFIARGKGPFSACNKNKIRFKISNKNKLPIHCCLTSLSCNLN